ncbi:MAG: hypothetical protein R2911_22870 [Caldilineaceae bacterium]
MTILCMLPSQNKIRIFDGRAPSAYNSARRPPNGATIPVHPALTLTLVAQIGIGFDQHDRT